jgi:hypothetical protein
MSHLTVEDSISLGVEEIANIVHNTIDISTLRHPNYDASDWEKWRLTYESGREFILEYLKKFSARESDDDFTTRRDISYVPAFAKAAVNDVKDSIFQRIADVTREGGSKTYLDAIKGKNGGIDLAGTTMNSFIGRNILSELLTMKKVGVFIDMPRVEIKTLSDQSNIRPYIYSYKAEDILNWSVDLKNKSIFTKLLLRDNVFELDEWTGLPINTEERFRFMWTRGENILVQFFNIHGPIDRFNQPGIDVISLNLTEIPFVLFEISDSLLRDVADYQIALLNLASSDIAFSLNSNFPFYVEQFDPRIDNLYTRPESGVEIVQSGEKDNSQIAKGYEVTVGTMTGRRIPKGLEMPRYIHPSPETLQASMLKQDELKKDIRMLIKLAISNLTPTMASAESKSFDERSLEAGLSAIGLELEHGERNIAKYWQMYEDKNEPPTIKYPQKYSLQSDKDKREEAKELFSSIKNSPSITYKREALKIASLKLLGAKVSTQVAEKIINEIEQSSIIYSDPNELNRDVELALIDLESASRAKGYPEGVVEKAKDDHADRLRRIAESQGQARGVPDLSGAANASRSEKMDKDEEPVATEKTRD